MGIECNSFGEKKCIQYFGGISEGQTLLGRHSPIYGDNINKDLKEIDQGSVDCILLVQNRDNWQTPVRTAESIRG